MRTIVLAPTPEVGQKWQYSLENLGEDWLCTPLITAEEALGLLKRTELLLIVPCRAGDALLECLERHPPLTPPYILGGPDGPLCPAEEIPELLSARLRTGCLPALCSRHMLQAKEVAAAFLRMLDVPRRLRAWDFLPEMIAAAVVHPPLLKGLRSHLYPLIAARHGMTAAGVERSLRLCIESTWTHGRLPALERFFGMNVDPEKGKLTNAAFLRHASAQVAEGMYRLIGAKP